MAGDDVNSTPVKRHLSYLTLRAACACAYEYAKLVAVVCAHCTVGADTLRVYSPEAQRDGRLRQDDHVLVQAVQGGVQVLGHAEQDRALHSRHR